MKEGRKEGKKNQLLNFIKTSYKSRFKHFKDTFRNIENILTKKSTLHEGIDKQIEINRERMETLHQIMPKEGRFSTFFKTFDVIDFKHSRDTFRNIANILTKKQTLREGINKQIEINWEHGNALNRLLTPAFILKLDNKIQASLLKMDNKINALLGGINLRDGQEIPVSTIENPDMDSEKFKALIQEIPTLDLKLPRSAQEISTTENKKDIHKAVEALRERIKLRKGQEVPASNLEIPQSAQDTPGINNMKEIQKEDNKQKLVNHNRISNFKKLLDKPENLR